MTMDTQDRIAQWEKMTREAPDGMAFFSLGNAYREAGEDLKAADALRQAILLDSGLSRAYQLLGQVLVKLNQLDEAGRVLTQGYIVAAGRGDVMPQRAIESLLKEKLGLPLPRVEKAPAEPAEPIVGEAVLDRRSGRQQKRLPDPPMRGPTGQFIYDHFGAETWREWIGMGTKVINELRLDFSNLEHQKTYEQHMLEWLGVSQQEIDDYAKRKPKA